MPQRKIVTININAIITAANLSNNLLLETMRQIPYGNPKYVTNSKVIDQLGLLITLYKNIS